MIWATLNGERRKVGTHFHESRRYVYVLRRPDDTDEWTRSADTIDAALDSLVKDKLHQTFEDGAWQKAIAAVRPNLDRKRRHLLAQIKAVEKTRDGYARNLPTLTNVDMIRQSQAYYEEAQREHTRLMADLAKLDDESGRIKALENLKDEIGPALEKWDSYSREKKQTILRRVIDEIRLLPMDGGSAQIVVFWRDRRTSTLDLRRKTSRGKQWTAQETETLLSLIDAGATQQDIAHAFPDRSWQAIR